MKAAFDAAEKSLSDARKDVLEKKAECKRKMSLKCDNCKNLKCKQAEDNCKEFLDAAGKWIGGVVDATGKKLRNIMKVCFACYQSIVPKKMATGTFTHNS